MKWDDSYQRDNGCYRWYDLLEGDGTDKDALLGYVRENLADHTLVAQINNRHQPSKKFDNLEDAKNFIIAYYVVQKLEGT